MADGRVDTVDSFLVVYNHGIFDRKLDIQMVRYE